MTLEAGRFRWVADNSLLASRTPQGGVCEGSRFESGKRPR